LSAAPFDDALPRDLPPVECYADEPAANSSRVSGNEVSKPAAGNGLNVSAEPLEVEPASELVGRAPPPPRDWVCEGLGLPAGRVTSFIGNGGFGKTTVAHQLGIVCATNRSIFGMPVNGGPVFGLFCEDEQAELDRKTRTICEAEGIDLGMLDQAYLLSRDGHDNILCSFEHDQIVLTDFYWRVDATFARLKPRLGIFDTAADLFAGDFMSTPHVRQFIKVALGGLCQRHGSAILLLAHPSASAMASGDGGGFSTAWNNSVRSRLYLRRPKSEDAEAIADRRVIEIRKANYGPSGGTVPLTYSNGRFILDAEPIEEGAKPIRAAKLDTRLSLAVMGYFNDTAAAGQVVRFGAIFEALQKTGHVPAGDYQTVRKPLQRVLTNLTEQNLLTTSDVPRGYRIARETAE
jgi:AAA domain